VGQRESPGVELWTAGTPSDRPRQGLVRPAEGSDVRDGLACPVEMQPRSCGAPHRALSRATPDEGVRGSI
jgi:hypothetical protein